MIGVQFIKDKASGTRYTLEDTPLMAIEKASKDLGLLVRSAGHTSSTFLLPPLIISEQETNELIERFTLAVNTVFSQQ